MTFSLFLFVLRSRAVGAFEGADAVVRLLDLRELALDYLAQVGGQVFVERALVVADGRVLAALALADDRALVLARDRGLDVNPAAVEAGGDAAPLLWVAAEPADLALQLGGELRPLLRVGQKERPQV